MSKFEYDDVYISVSESRTLYAGTGNSEPLVRLQDKLAEQWKVEIKPEEDEDEIPF